MLMDELLKCKQVALAQLSEIVELRQTSRTQSEFNQYNLLAESAFEDLYLIEWKINNIAAKQFN